MTRSGGSGNVEKGRSGEMVSPNLSESFREDQAKRGAMRKQKDEQPQLCPLSRIRISDDAMHFTVLRRAETLQNPATRGLPEQSRLQRRGGYRARASFQNQKFETHARCQPGAPEPKKPTHLGLSREQGEGLMSSHEKAMASLRACFCCEVVCLLVEVSVCLRAKEVPSVHCPLVPRRRSSSF